MSETAVNPAAASRPTLSVCIIARNASETFEAMLKSVREKAPKAEIVVVDTCSSDKTVEIAQKYADKVVEYTGPNGTWTKEMYAFDDAAAARNKSFELATGKWVMWIDADDVLPPAAEVQRLLELNGRWKPGGVAGLNSKGERGAKADEVLTLEEFLENVEADPAAKELQGFYAPYLYQSDADGRAITWQSRERIVRNNGEWFWQRKAHEVLVPKNPQNHARMSTLSTLLFVHKKKFDVNDRLFSLTRHFNILIADYDKGVRNCQDLLYLENYAMFLCPARRAEFIDAMFDCAYTAVDRARANIRRANLAAAQGFFFDAVEGYSAAAQVCPDFPDSMFQLAELYVKAEQYGAAVEWFERGIATPAGHAFSDVAPREHLVATRLKAALAAHHGSKRALGMKRLDIAESFAEKAAALARAAFIEPCIGPDRVEAAQWFGLFQNEYNGLLVIKHMHAVWDYLVKNDETQKARELLTAVPHNQLEHPLVVELEEWARKMDTHFTDIEEYQEFYEQIGTDITSQLEYLTPDKALPRAQFAIRVLAKENPKARVLEVGPFDGITAIPMLRALPDIHITGLEIKKSAAESLKKRAIEAGLGDRLAVVHGQLDDLEMKIRLQEIPEQFDAIVFYEVIEHVPDPADAIKQLAKALKPGGLLFVSTPWGAFDRGHQPSPESRDARGHVRAMMPRELIDAIESDNMLRVEHQAGCHSDANYGDTLHLVARKFDLPMTRDNRLTTGQKPVSFAVASALWDWNGSHVVQTGIGASEETIVYLARELAKKDAADVRVYGPLPKVHALFEEEVAERVKYHPRDQFRHIDAGGPVVVSRAPSMGRYLDQVTGKKLRKVLWLQDAGYPDLNVKTAEDYEKIVVLSKWQRDLFVQSLGIPQEKFEVVPNFLLKEHFSTEQVEYADQAAQDPIGSHRERWVKRDPFRFIYASSPDRGLMRLLKMWPKVKKEYPEATLGVFYGWEGCMKLSSLDAGWNARHKSMRTEYLKLKDQPGIEEYGRVNHARIADEFRRATAWLYPTDFDETFCSTAIKARAAGCVPVCTPRAALNESALCAQTRYVEGEQPGETWGDYEWRFLTAVKSAVEETPHERVKMAEEAIEKFALEAIMPLWKKVLG